MPHSWLEVTAQHIKALSDSELRDLIRRLCETEIRLAGFPISVITAGGDQRAADAGVDVRVALNASPPPTSFIPHANTVFQVKQERAGFGPQRINAEMAPRGTPRPILVELAHAGGGYIIVSGGDSPSASAWQRRLQAMHDAVRSVANYERLHLDFFGGDRVAQWVNQHPGLVLWVLSAIGQARKGWRPYEAWSSPDATDTAYLSDATARIYEGWSDEAPLTVEAGIARMRTALAQAGKAIRLVGLSGVGKTRLAEALFDPAVGDGALDPNLAVYADLGDEPEPSPRDALAHLAREKMPTVVIVDNCLPKLHRDLVAELGRTGGAVSLITVEYDVGEDEPEGTDVFRLEPASGAVTENLLKQRDRDLSGPDAARIAELSGGNAKLALMLARTAKNGDSLSRFTDSELFRRIFRQRNPDDDSLLQAAEACALVYSFDGETLDGGDAELPHLAALADQSPEQMYRLAAKLKERGVVQRRGRWRALLPHVLANRMAGQALDRIPVQRLVEVMERQAPERLLRSFTRRLGHLHESGDAKEMVAAWLAPGGMLGDVANLTGMRLDMLANVAPVDPAATLAAIERAARGEQGNRLFDPHHEERSVLISLLLSLAYDADLFTRSARLLMQCTLTEDQNEENLPIFGSSRNDFRELFRIRLSGTHATLDQRLDVINEMLHHASSDVQKLGLEALGSMLETPPFSVVREFSFGARPRDWGWEPQTYQDQSEWYGTAIARVRDLATAPGPLHDRAQELLADSFRGLWPVCYCSGDLERAVCAVAGQGFWADGWIAVRTAIAFDGKDMPADALDRLRTLEIALRPKDLIDQVRAYVLTQCRGSLDIADGEQGLAETNHKDPYEKLDNIAKDLGRQIATNEEVLGAILPDVVHTAGFFRRTRVFGGGLAEATSDLSALWRRLVDALAAVPEDQRDPTVLCGFLGQAVVLDPVVTNQFLDEAVDDPLLARFFVYLQNAVPIDGVGASRLKAALAHGVVTARDFAILSRGRATDPIPSADLRDLLLELADQPDGYAVAVEILFMRLWPGPNTNRPVIHAILLECGRELIRRCSFDKLEQNHVDHLAELAGWCLGATDTEVTSSVCATLEKMVPDRLGDLWHYKKFLAEIFCRQPELFLDRLLYHPAIRSVGAISRMRSNRGVGVWDKVPVEAMLRWADSDPQTRYLLIAHIIPLFTRPDEDDVAISPAAVEVIKNAPDKAAVFKQLGMGIDCGSFFGSLVPQLERRRKALDSLRDLGDPLVTHWVNDMQQRLSDSAARHQNVLEREDESFE